LDHPHDVIFNESHCSIVTNEIRTSPELHGEMQENIDSSKFYISDQLCIVADHEIPLKIETTPEVARLNEVKSKVVVLSQTFDINSIFKIRQISLPQAQQAYLHLIVTTSVCKIAIVSVLYFSSLLST